MIIWRWRDSEITMNYLEAYTKEREGGGYSESETKNEREKVVLDVGDKERRDSEREGRYIESIGV
jgi:hypothetical protein